MPTKRQLQDQVSMLNDALEAALSLSPERDNNFFTGGLSGLYEGRSSWDRKKVFAESLRAWRVNPIARRIVKLMTSFAVGKGLTIKSDDPQVQDFLQSWWNHPLNKFSRNVKRWKDEDTRTGNLFFLFNVLPDGMSIIRAVAAEKIEEIETTENDVEQETGYFKDEAKEEKWEAYNGKPQPLFMVHYASNQPVGSPWGEADLSPLLVWIGRFSAWLENRARLNQFRTAFMYVVQGAYASESERSSRERTLQANPPKPGSVLVMNTNNGEQWGILSANLDAFDASMDGTALKKMIMDGIGHPMHWHAEPEGGTQTTAEAAGTPTFRTLEEMQNDFFEMLIDMGKIALQIKGIQTKAKIWIEGPDITERDNATLALALGRAYPNLAEMLDREAIDDAEFLRLVYKMFAEVWDKSKTPKIKRKPLVKASDLPPPEPPAGSTPTDSKTDPGDPAEEQSNSTIEKWDERLQDIIAGMPKPDAPTINITNQLPEPKVEVTNEVQTPSVTVQNQIPEQAAPIVSVTNEVQTPAVTIENAIPAGEPPTVNITNEVQTPSVTVENQIPQLAPPKAAMLQTEPALPKRRKAKK